MHVYGNILTCIGTVLFRVRLVFLLSTLYSPTEAATVQNKQFLPKEALVYIRLVKFALQALDIYTINIGANGQAVIRPAV